MTEQAIDFGNFNRKILINPSVVLNILDVYYRNNEKLQVTLLGKVYADAIEILEMVPVGFCGDAEIVRLDFVEHSGALQNIRTVYPNLLVIGTAVTDLKIGKSLAILHTMYNNKQSYFKPEGILTQPIIVSLSTRVDQHSENLGIDAYTFNQPYLFCKDLMGITSFQKLQVSVSFGESDFQSMVPLFQALNDNVEMVPQKIEDQLQKLAHNLTELKTKCSSSEDKDNEELMVQIRRSIDYLKFHTHYDMKELAYLLEISSLMRNVTNKVTELHKA